MSLFLYIRKKIEFIKSGAYIDIQTESLKQNVSHTLLNIPKKMIYGIEILEQVFDSDDISDNQIIVNSTMNTIDIKRQLGKFIFKSKRWSKQEEIATKLISEEKIDLNLFYKVYNTNDFLVAYSYINADVFAVAYGNDFLTIDEISSLINSLYLKKQNDNKIDEKMNNFVDSLFEK